jgi:hypothetical protein
MLCQTPADRLSDAGLLLPDALTETLGVKALPAERVGALSRP